MEIAYLRNMYSNPINFTVIFSGKGIGGVYHYNITRKHTHVNMTL
jgi:hypothetical protein